MSHTRLKFKKTTTAKLDSKKNEKAAKKLLP